MKINFSLKSKEYLKDVKDNISKNSPTRATPYISKLIHRIIKILRYPNIGKINTVHNNENIREIFLDGYKIIYKINQKSILVLMIYKNIDFDEKDLG